MIDAVVTCFRLLVTLALGSAVIMTNSVASTRPDSHVDAHLSTVISTEDARHLLMRTGIGARPEDILALRGLSRKQAIDHIIQGISGNPHAPMPEWVSRPVPLYHARPDMDDEARAKFNNERDAELAQLRQWWVLNILQTSSPQTERMVLFWHDLFATNYHSLGKQSLAMARQNQTFRALGFGSWERLLKAMIRDAALLEFLDSGSNHKISPNENLARELMELFVLGEGNYDEMTVREAARSLTGHDTSRFHDLRFWLKTWAQDRGEKQLFGHTGAFDGDALVELLLVQEAAPQFLTTKFWYAFVSDREPDQGWVDEQARQFRRSDLDIATLYQNVLQSEAFWHADNRGSMIKSPVDIVAGTARTLDYPMSQWQRMPQWQKLIGMDLFAPPNVSGWKEGAAFITPGHLLNRYKVLRQLIRAPANKTELKQSGSKMAASAMQGMINASGSPGMDVAQEPTGRAMMQTENRDKKPQSGPVPDIDNTTLRASAIHVQRGGINKKNGNTNLAMVLDHLQTPGKDFQHVLFTLEKKNNQPMMLKLDSFHCWPDCIDPWPECAWVDTNFTANKHITMPWVAIDDERWSTKYDHRCQFDSLSTNEKNLVSTLWTELPYLLAQARKTNRVKANSERWLPVISLMEAQYRQGVQQMTDTAYTPFAQAFDISSVYAPSDPAHQSLTAPVTRIEDVATLMDELSDDGMLIHELLLPLLSGDDVPELPRNDAKRPGRYLRAVLEHPLFQLK